MGGGDVSTFVFVPKIGSDVVHITQQQSHYLMVFFGVSSVASRLVIGVALKMFRPLTIWSLGCLGSGVCCAVYPFLTDYPSLVTFVALHGLFSSAYISTLALSALDIFGIGKVNCITGILHFLTGIGGFAIPPVVGFLFETFTAPSIPCIVMGCVYVTGFFFGALTWAMILKFKHTRNCEISFSIRRGSIVTIPNGSNTNSRKDSTMHFSGITSELQ